MATEAAGDATGVQALADEDVVERVRNGDRPLFEVLMRRYNRRLFRAARAILGDDREAEDVMQDAYLRAYTHLDQFAGRASFATWLTKIAVYEALARLRRRGRFVDLEDTMPVLASDAPDPERQAADRELGSAMEAAIDTLPEAYRAVFVLRDVEGLSTADTAASLGIGEATAKTRLHRARTMLRGQLAERAGETFARAYEFAGTRCDRVVAAVMERITAPPRP